MEITYCNATAEDIEPIYILCRQLIDSYENLEAIDYPKVLQWVRRKIEKSIDEYTVIEADGQKAGYFRFCQNGDGLHEIDDLYVFPAFQNRGIGSAVIEKCCRSCREDVMLYVFSKNTRAVSLYQRLGFEIVETVRNSRYIMKRKNSHL